MGEARRPVLRDHAGFVEQFGGASEINLAVKVKGGQPLRAQMDIGETCTHWNAPRVAGQIQSGKRLGGLPNFPWRRTPLFVEKSPDGVGAPAGTCGECLARVYRNRHAARRAAIQTRLRYLLIHPVQSPSLQDYSTLRLPQAGACATYVSAFSGGSGFSGFSGFSVSSMPALRTVTVPRSVTTWMAAPCPTVPFNEDERPS